MNEQIDWNSDFLTRYTTYSSRHSSPERPGEDDRFGGFNSSPISPFFASDKPFCRRDNVDQCIAYLNQELSILGFPSLFVNSNNKHEETFDIVKLINSTYELLQLQQQNLKTRTSLEERNLRSECDNEHLVVSQKRLKEQVESLHREVAQYQEVERRMQAKIKQLKEQLKNEIDEVKKTKASAQQQHKQFSHDKKKQEREMNKLKERVHQMLSDRNQEKRIGMEILNSLQRADGKRAMWKTGNRDENEMYRLLITNYEARQKELTKENTDLRESLQAMQAELISVLNQQQQASYDSDDEDNSIDCSLSVRSLPAGHFHMPYELVREGIEKSLRDKWRMLRSRLDQASKAASPAKKPVTESKNRHELEDSVDKLTNQLDNYRHIVEQQESLIETLATKDAERNAGQDNSFMSDSRICEEWDRLQKERSLYSEQKETFDKERKNFTDAAIKLGHERKKFEEERTTFYKQQLMITPQQRRISSGSKKTRSPDGRISPPKLQFSTPMFSPAPRKTWDSSAKPVRVPRDGPITSPTTQDLYHALSLPSETDDGNVINETPKLHFSSGSPDVADATPTCGSLASGRSSDSKENLLSSSSKNRRINEHAQHVKRALELKQQSPSFE